MNLSDFNSYSSDSRSHSPPNDESKWVDDDDYVPVQQTLLSDNSVDDSKKKSNHVSDASEHSHHSVSSKSSHSSISSVSSKKQKDLDQKGNKKTDQNISKDKKSADKKSDKQDSNQLDKNKKAKPDQKETKKTNAKKGYFPTMQVALSGNKIAFSEGVWRDVTDLDEINESVHPIVAESISLQKRAELLVRLISESEYESQLIQNEINECDDVIKQLKGVLGEEKKEKRKAKKSSSDDENDDDDDDESS